MTRYLSVTTILRLQRRIIELTGGSFGVRDRNGLISAVDQPRMTFGGEELYRTIPQKGAALAFSLINNHPFVDGNKRIGYVALDIFLQLNGYELEATVDDKEQVILAMASSTTTREEFVEWLDNHTKKRAS